MKNKPALLEVFKEQKLLEENITDLVNESDKIVDEHKK